MADESDTITADAVLAILLKRRAAYVAKRERFSILDDDCLTHWECFNSIIEALEIVIEKIRRLKTTAKVQP